MAVRRSIIWIDVGGRTRQTVFVASAPASSIMSALKGHSNADVYDWVEGPDNFNPSPAPTLATFPDVKDAARLIFADAGGNQASLTLPAPKLSIFLADGVTVNPSAIADVITAAQAAMLTSAGNLVTNYLAGVRTGRTSVG